MGTSERINQSHPLASTGLNGHDGTGLPEECAVAHETIWLNIHRALAARQTLALVTIVKVAGSVPRRAGARMLVYTEGNVTGTIGGGLLESLVIQDCVASLQTRCSVTRVYSLNPRESGPHAIGAVCGGRLEVFIEVLEPPSRLIIVGGGHCGLALARAAALLDFVITIVDDRMEYADPSRFPLANIESVIHCGPEFLEMPTPDPNTYIALMSKGAPSDAAALQRIVFSDAAYIGMIGSIKKRSVVFDTLEAAGVPLERLQQVHAPIGVEIGADTPAEIAISVLADIISVRSHSRSSTRNDPTSTA